MKKEKKTVVKSRNKDIEDSLDLDRKAFTKNWDQSFSTIEKLPIKHGNKVLRVIANKNDDEDKNSNDESEKSESEGSERSDDEVSVDDTDKEVSEEVLEKGNNHLKYIHLSQYDKKVLIGDICTSILADPEKAMKKRRNNDKRQSTDEEVHTMSDLITFLKDPDLHIQEVAVLSCLLVFKDICPSYRIRGLEEQDKTVQLKKDTKKLRDYELSLLLAYKIYLKRLTSLVSAGLGKGKANKGESAEWHLGLSALRCQCELARKLSHFNFRPQLINSIVTNAISTNEVVQKLCCDTIRQLFESDTEGEISFEIIRNIASELIVCKYIITSTSLLNCLLYPKLTVHADQAKDVRRKAKQSRRKRRRQNDDIDSEMLEAEVVTSKTTVQRFQADSLHEVCLIYFRYRYNKCYNYLHEYIIIYVYYMLMGLS
jgi:nucleolar complex protein 3